MGSRTSTSMGSCSDNPALLPPIVDTQDPYQLSQPSHAGSDQPPWLRERLLHLPNSHPCHRNQGCRIISFFCRSSSWPSSFSRSLHYPRFLPSLFLDLLLLLRPGSFLSFGVCLSSMRLNSLGCETPPSCPVFQCVLTTFAALQPYVALGLPLNGHQPLGP